MSHILVGFSTKHDSLLSRLICWATHWRHSHVVLISTDQTRMIESTGIVFPDPETGVWRDGVREVPIAYLLMRDVVEIRKIPHPAPEKVWEEARKLIGKKYDHEYLGAWFLRKGNGDDNKITCNEVIEISAAQAGHALFPADVKNTTPRDLYLLSEAL